MILKVPKIIMIQEILVEKECYWKYLNNNNSGNPGEDGMLLEVPPKIIIIQETLVKTECYWKYIK
jgi:hypothetical protein